MDILDPTPETLQTVVSELQVDFQRSTPIHPQNRLTTRREAHIFIHFVLLSAIFNIIHFWSFSIDPMQYASLSQSQSQK